MSITYFTHPRPEVRRLLDDDGPILDVGCGAGALCADLARRGICVVGVEPVEDAARQAGTVYSMVHNGSFNTFDPPLQFHQAVFADVLEHMEDPWSALKRTREHLLAPGGRVVASIPNVRHWTVVRDLVFRGRWTYQEAGLMDRTHLRFFTKREIVQMFSATGFEVQSVQPHFERRLLRMLDVATLGMLTEFLVIQWLIVARPAGSVGADR